MKITVLFFVYLLWTILTAFASCNPLDRIVAHAHLRGGKLYPCFQNTCDLEPSTKLYFWIRRGQYAPNMFLRSHSLGETIHITTSPVADPSRLTLTKTLKHELDARSNGESLLMVEAEFPEDIMRDTTYTFLMTDNFQSWIAVDMTCERIRRRFERFRKGHRLLCTLDKRDWANMREAINAQ